MSNLKNKAGVKTLLAACIALSTSFPALAGEFSYDAEAITSAKPWTSDDFRDNPENFQFVVIGDRTGGANVEGTFNLAVDQIRLLQPEFVINVGDMIEGYSDDPAELNAEWDEVDAMLAKVDVPFFRTT